MKTSFSRFVTHPLISRSSTLFLGVQVANVLNFLFNLGMLRALSVSDYGLFISINSVIVLFSILATSLTGIFTKFTTASNAREDTETFSALLTIGYRYVLLFATIVFIILLVLTPFLIPFLHISSLWPMLFAYLAIFMFLQTTFPLGVLQGQFRFSFVSLLLVLNPIVRIAVSSLLVFMGFAVAGAVFGYLTADIVMLIVALIIVFSEKRKNTFHTVEVIDKLKQELKTFSWPFLLATISLSSIQYADVLLARHFFPVLMAGQYAALSLTGRVIFYITMPLTMAFFPMIVAKKEKHEPYQSTLLLGVALVLLLSGILSAIYFLFPHLVVAIFAPGQSYRILASYEGTFSLYILCFSLLSLLANFLLAIGKTKIYLFNILAFLMFVILVSFFHQTIWQMIDILIAVSVVLLILYSFLIFRENA